MDALGHRVVTSRLAAVALGGCALCACAYQPGSFRAPGQREFGSARATVGCLDVAIAGRWGRSGSIGQVIEFDFGNRCDRPVTVDFTALHAFGVDERGQGHALAIHDPRGEVRPLGLEARTVGREVLELRRRAAVTRLRSACVDVARIVAGAAPLWICVRRPGESLARKRP
jgi:hypothetical protein